MEHETARSEPPKYIKDEKGRFLTGNIGGRRPKGSRAKLGEQFVSALQQDFEAYGAAVIEKVRTDRPQDYLKVLASILPKELNVKVDALDDMSDDDLADTLERLRDLALALDDKIARAGEREAEEAEPARLIPTLS